MADPVQCRYLCFAPGHSQHFAKPLPHRVAPFGSVLGVPERGPHVKPHVAHEVEAVASAANRALLGLQAVRPPPPARPAGGRGRCRPPWSMALSSASPCRRSPPPPAGAGLAGGPRAGP